MLPDSCKGVVVARDDSSTSLALVDERDLAKVVTLVQQTNHLLSAVMVTHLDLAVAGAHEVHAQLIFVVVILLDHLFIRQVERGAQGRDDGLKEQVSTLLCVVLHWSGHLGAHLDT